MKKILFALAFAACIAVAATSAHIATDNTVRLNRISAASTNEIRELRSRISELEEDPECFAILREIDGIIGLYDTEGKVLLCTINTPVISLPERQRSEIMIGMRVENPSHFIKLFESLTE